MIKVVIVRPNMRPYLQKIEGDLDSLRKIVNGYIECVNLGGGITLVCNEEGKIHGLTPNRVVSNDVICGNFLLTKTDTSNGEFIDLTQKEIDMLLYDFSHVEIG